MKYSDYKPTEFDIAGLGLTDRQDWIVVPIGRNRESGCLAKSNFAAALDILGGKSDTVEVHRFGHWACGWLEIIIIHPSMQDKSDDIESRLENYPVLDDEDLSKRQEESYEEAWRNYGAREFKSEIAKQIGLSDLAEQAIDTLTDDKLRTFFESLIVSGDYYNPEDGSPRISLAIDKLVRKDVADLIRTTR